MGKLTSLPFQACKHHISSLDAQPSLSGGVLVFVTGQLLVRRRGGWERGCAWLSVLQHRGCCCCMGGGLLGRRLATAAAAAAVASCP